MLGVTLCFGVQQEAGQTDCLMKPTLVIRKMPDLQRRELDSCLSFCIVSSQGKC